MTDTSKPRRIPSRGLVLLVWGLAGMVYSGAGLLVNPWTLRMVSSDGVLLGDTQRRALFCGWFFGALALLHVLAALPPLARRWAEPLRRHPRLLAGLGCGWLLLALLLAADAALGVKTARKSPVEPLYEVDMRLGFRVKPDGRWFNGEPMNRWGLRGPAPSKKPDPARRRLLFMGDSLIFGHGVEADETIPVRLGELLGPDWEVVNGGLPALNPQQYYYMADALLEFEPERVLLGICLNDVAHVSRSRLRGRPGGEDYRPQPPSWPYRLRWFLEIYSGLYNVRELWRDAPSTPEEIGHRILADTQYLLEDEAHLRRQLAATEAYLRALRDKLRGRGLELRLVVFPFRFQYTAEGRARYPDHLRLQRELMAMSGRLGLEALDLYEPVGAEIARLGGDPGAVFVDYDHFNPQGCRFVAERVRDWLAAGGWLSGGD